MHETCCNAASGRPDPDFLPREEGRGVDRRGETRCCGVPEEGERVGRRTWEIPQGCCLPCTSDNIMFTSLLWCMRFAGDWPVCKLDDHIVNVNKYVVAPMYVFVLFFHIRFPLCEDFVNNAVYSTAVFEVQCHGYIIVSLFTEPNNKSLFSS